MFLIRDQEGNKASHAVWQPRGKPDYKDLHKRWQLNLERLHAMKDLGFCRAMNCARSVSLGSLMIVMSSTCLLSPGSVLHRRSGRAGCETEGHRSSVQAAYGHTTNYQSVPIPTYLYLSLSIHPPSASWLLQTRLVIAAEIR